MSVQPIDLQVLFARLNQIGREQLAQRNSIVQAQAVAASEIPGALLRATADRFHVNSIEADTAALVDAVLEHVPAA